MSDKSAGDADGGALESLFATTTTRTGEGSLSTWIHPREGLLDGVGALRIGAVTYAADVATGLTMGLAVLDRDRWTVTTDLDVHVTTPVTVGPLRIDTEMLRAGDTTAVCAFTLHDEAGGRAVGGGTGTGRPFPFTFDRSRLEIPLGGTRRHGERAESETEGIATRLGFSVGEDGSVEVAVRDWLRNPWGILHGGVTACLVDLAAEIAGSSALGRRSRVASQMVRYLAPGRVGPVRAVPHVLDVGAGGAMVEVRVTDEGADGRLIALGSLTAK